MRVRTQGTPHPPRHLLAMSPYFYLNELLVQVIRTLVDNCDVTPWSHPLGYPCVYVGVFPRRIYSDCIHPDEKVK